MTMLRFKKAQSTMEYILLVGGFIAVLVFLLSPGGIVHNTISHQINQSIDQIGTMTESTNFQNSQVEH